MPCSGSESVCQWKAVRPLATALTECILVPALGAFGNGISSFGPPAVERKAFQPRPTDLPEIVGRKLIDYFILAVVILSQLQFREFLDKYLCQYRSAVFGPCVLGFGAAGFRGHCSRGSGLWQSAQLVIHPVHLLVVRHRCCVLLYRFVSDDGRAGRNHAAQFRMNAGGSFVVEGRILQAKFLGSWGSQSTGSSGAIFFRYSGFKKLGRSSSSIKGDFAIQVGQSPHGSKRSSTLMRESTAEARIAMLDPDPSPTTPTRSISRSPRSAR